MTVFSVYIHFNAEIIPKGFTVCHLNSRSLRKKVNELGIIVDKHTFDIISLSETWLDDRDTLVIVLNLNMTYTAGPIAITHLIL